MARQLTLKARPLTVEELPVLDFTDPNLDDEKKLEEVSVDPFEGLDNEALEQEFLSLGGNLNDLPLHLRDPFGESDEFDGKSVEELEVMIAQLQAPPKPKEKERIEPEATRFEFLSSEINDSRVVNLEQQVSGKPRGIQALEQLFELAWKDMKKVKAR